MFHVEHELVLRTNGEAKVVTYSLQLGGHTVFVDRGTRAEEHWLSLGYLDSAAANSVPGEPNAGDEKPRRKARKVAAEVTSDE